MASQLDERQLFSPEAMVSLSISIADLANQAIFQNQNGRLGKNHSLAPSITKGMDLGFRAGFVDLASSIPITPWNHRILLPGHTLAESLAIAWRIAREQNAKFTETLSGWLLSYLADFCSPAGMPIGGWSRPCYLLLRKAGVRDAHARKVVTTSAQRSTSGILQGGLTALSLAKRFGTAGSIPLSRGIGKHLASSIVLKSPAMGLVTLAGLAKAHQVGQLDTEALVKGALSSLVSSGTDLTIKRLGVRGLLPGLLVVGISDYYLASEESILDQARQTGRKVRNTVAIGRAFWQGFWRHLKSTKSDTR